MKKSLFTLLLLAILVPQGYTSAQSVSGCTNSGAINYNKYANYDDGSCAYGHEQIPEDFYVESSCDPKFKEFVKTGSKGSEVTLWQNFLNFGFNEEIPETGYYGSQTTGAVKRFQEFFMGAILSPWGLTEGTGQVYQTTRSWANRITGCNEEAFDVEGKTVNHARYATPRGYDFLKTFGTPGATGFTTLTNVPEQIIVPITTPMVSEVTVVTPTTPVVTPTTPVVTSTNTELTGDAEIDALLQAISSVEAKIESLN